MLTMADINIIRNLYNQCKDMDIEESIDLLLKAESKEEQDFISLVSDFVLQRKQREIIEQKKFLKRKDIRKEDYKGE